MSTNPEARAWVEVRADALRANYARIRRQVGAEVGVVPMVKADAYGLGVERAVDLLSTQDPWGFGVATVDEGIDLRRLGVERPVVVFSPVPHADVGRAIQAGLDLSVSSLDGLDAVVEAAGRVGRTARAHIDVDTGMGRSGFPWDRHAEWLPTVEDRLGTEEATWVGLFSHLHSADESAGSVRDQGERLSTVRTAIVDPPAALLVHLLNSPGAFRAPERAAALVRPGIFLYGGAVGDDLPAPEPVVSVRARVAHLRSAEPGTTLGYGATHVAEGDERWATLAIGYGDGVPRALGNRGSALVGGRRAPIVGRISMDVTVVDISGVPDVAVGDVATLIGQDGDETITVDDVANEAGTISYEILTGLTRRLPRIWIHADG